MIKIPNRVFERLSSGIKKFQPIISSAKSRDVNESDTVIIITDLFSEIFGYDKYSEITSEFSIRSTYCDLATKIDGKPQILIEIKAIGLELKDSFVKQAIDYAANQGIDFVILTNSVLWKVFRVSFGKPINHELVVEFDFLNLNSKYADDIEKLYFISKEGWLKSSLYDYHSQRQVLSRFYLGAMILTDSVIDCIRKELRKISPDIKIDSEQIRKAIGLEVLKREVVEGEKAEDARKKLNKALNKAIKNKGEKSSEMEKTLNATTGEIDTEEIIT